MKDFGEYLIALRGEFDSAGCIKTMRDEFGVECEEQPCAECHEKMMGELYDRYRDDFYNLLPAGVEWPRYADGRLVKLDDEFWCDKKRFIADKITFGSDGVSVGDCSCYEGDGIEMRDTWQILAKDILAKAGEATPKDAREWADRAASLQLGEER